MNQPLDLISTEMVFRGLYHFSQAVLRGDGNDAVWISQNQASAPPLRLTLTPNKFGQNLLKLTPMSIAKPLREIYMYQALCEMVLGIAAQLFLCCP